jgi:sugar lactone lactonase YvrE
VLGFDFDSTGNLIAADAMKGLLSISPSRQITVLSNQVDGQPIRYADGVVVARSGTMYFTDASTRFSPADWGGTFEASVLDILEQAATGRVLAYDPATKATRVVARGLAFANGVALNADEKSLFVAETGKYRIWKIDVNARNLDAGASAGTNPQAAVLLDNLPGYPDNLMRGIDGKIWAGLVKPRNPTIDKLADKPFLRSVTMRLPRALWPVPKAYGHVVAFSEDGKVLASLQDETGAYPETTGITETRERLYVQSLHAKGLGWLKR